MAEGSAVSALTPAAIPGAMRLKEAAGWNQTEADWRNLLHLSPAGVFGIECDGALAATASGVCYGDRLAWIGMVLTHPDFRGRGFARRLMEHTIAWIEARGVDWIKLDATDMGRPLYARLGFADECVIERWGRPARTPRPAPELSPARVGDWLPLDCAAFGAARREILDVLAPLGSAAVPGGYAMGRDGSKAAYFGPCVARDPDSAAALLDWWIGRNPERPIYWDILETNPAAAELARTRGFSPLRRLVRMVRPGRPHPRPLANHDSNVFAIAGFEYG